MEVKFKAKTTQKINQKHAFNGIWVQGDLIHSGGKTYMHPQCNRVDVNGELGKIIVMHEVDSSTICRCVENSILSWGVNAWENDVVRYNDAVGVIRYGVFNKKHIGFYIEWLGKYHDYRNDIVFWLPKVIIIGNTIDNPELLEVGGIHE